MTLFSIVYVSFGMFKTPSEPIVQGIDDTMYYIWARSLIIDRDLDFRNDLEISNTVDENAKKNQLSSITKKNLIANKYWIGWAIMNAPVIYLTFISIKSIGIEANGYEHIFFINIMIFQLCLFLTSLLLSYKILNRFYSAKVSYCAVILTWLCSPLIYYQTARFSMVHNQLYLLTVAIIYLSFKIIDRKAKLNTWLLLGLYSGILIVTRSTSIVYLTFTSFVLLNYINTKDIDLQARIRNLSIYVTLLIIPILIQLVAWKTIYGSYIYYSYQGESFDFSSPNLWGVLFSNFHGLFNWHPIALIGLIGFIFHCIKERSGLSFCISIVSISYINASWWSYWFGSSFGNRAFEGIFLFIMLGVAYLITYALKSERMKYIFTFISLILITWNTQLLIGWFVQSYERESPVTYKERMIFLGNQKNE